MTEKDREMIINLWQNRNSLKKIEQMLPYDKNTARAMIDEVKKSGALKKENRILPKSQRIYELYKKGTTVLQLSEMFSISTGYVCKCLNENGVHTGRPSKNHKQRKLVTKTQNIISELKDNNSSHSDIARKYDVSRQYVHKIYNKFIKDKQI